MSEEGNAKTTINLDADDDVQEAIPLADSEDEAREVHTIVDDTEDEPPTRPQPNGTTKKVVTNGGGAKTSRPKPASKLAKSRKNASNAAPINVDGTEDDSEPEPSSSRLSKVEKENKRLKEKLEEAQERISKLKALLEESFRTRETEPEELLKRETERFNITLQVKEDEIKQLNSALAKKEPLMKRGKIGAVQLLTREAADQEKRMLEDELRKLKEAAQENEVRFREKEELEKELRTELQLEVERSKAIASKQPARIPPGSAQRGAGGVLGSDEPKHRVAISFYEDLTNLLVTNIKRLPSQYLDLEEWSLTCIYTFALKDGTALKSLSFTLKFCWDIAPDEVEPITSKDQLVHSAKFHPLELDKEPKEFAQKLGFLATPFTFERTQLPLFLKSVHDKVGEALGVEQGEEESDADENDDEGVQEVMVID